MSELKPCPFCGGEAKVIRVIGDISDCPYSFAACKECGSATRQVSADVDYCAKERVVELWNRRVEESNECI